MNKYTIGEAAARFHIPESTLRYYEKQGLLPQIERDEAGRRLFSEGHMALLGTVICLKNTHMPLSQIKQYVDWILEGDATLALRLSMMRAHKQAVLEEISLMTQSIGEIDFKIDRYVKLMEEQDMNL